MTPIRLNIGAGDSNIPGFIPIDIKTGTDITSRLPYRDGEVDESYCSHCLEHIHHSRFRDVMQDMVRVLKPGGRIRIHVPDFEEIFRQIQTGEMSLPMANAWLYGSRDDATDRHQHVFRWEDLEFALLALGIEGIKRCEPEYQDCSQIPLNMGIEGRKRQVVIKSNPKVVMILSTGRFGPIDLYHGVAEHCRVNGWKLFQWGGDNWAKALTQLIRGAIESENPDYILTLDFDSCFDASETKKLVDWMQEHPEVAAVWPVQAHRHTDLPLGYAPLSGALEEYNFRKDNPWGGEFTQYGSGHFGCTVIRRQVFDTMGRPWFKGQPSNTTGDWDNDALDNDISFWVAMQGHGFVFGQLNTVQIGHMEWCVKWIFGDKIQWQPIQHYRKNGRPKEAVFDGQAWNRKMRKRLGVSESSAAQEAGGVCVPPPAPVSGSPELNPPPPSTNDPEAFEAMRRLAELECSGCNNGAFSKRGD